MLCNKKIKQRKKFLLIRNFVQNYQIFQKKSAILIFITISYFISPTSNIIVVNRSSRCKSISIFNLSIQILNLTVFFNLPPFMGFFVSIIVILLWFFFLKLYVSNIVQLIIINTKIEMLSGDSIHSSGGRAVATLQQPALVRKSDASFSLCFDLCINDT